MNINIRCSTDKELIKMYSNKNYTEYYKGLIKTEIIKRKGITKHD